VPNDPTLKHGRQSVTLACDNDNQISFVGETQWAVAVGSGDLSGVLVIG
jgi:hypothetical protein